MSNDLHKFLISQGTLSQLSCVKTPQQNGVSEHKYHHIVETAWTLLNSLSVPKEF